MQSTTSISPANTIVYLKLLNGEDIVSQQLVEDEKNYIVINPLLVQRMYHPVSGMMFLNMIPWSPLLELFGIPHTIPKSNVATQIIINPEGDMQKNYTTMVHQYTEADHLTKEGSMDESQEISQSANDTEPYDDSGENSGTEEYRSDDYVDNWSSADDGPDGIDLRNESSVQRSEHQLDLSKTSLLIAPTKDTLN